TLTVLNLSGNQIGDAGIQKLADILQVNKTLISLQLIQNQISKRIQQELNSKDSRIAIK
ncbi:unnamed protein product, partial [Rotaria sordida]